MPLSNTWMPRGRYPDQHAGIQAVRATFALHPGSQGRHQSPDAFDGSQIIRVDGGMLPVLERRRRSDLERAPLLSDLGLQFRSIAGLLLPRSQEQQTFRNCTAFLSYPAVQGRRLGILAIYGKYIGQFALL